MTVEVVSTEVVVEGEGSKGEVRKAFIMKPTHVKE